MESKESFIFCQNNLMFSSFSTFEEMRDKSELIDFKIAFENRSLEGHRVVLAAAIPYFREIFRIPEKESSLDCVDPDTLEAVIDFAYSGKIEITCNNVQSLILTAKFFHLGEVYDSCCTFLEKRLHTNNVLDILTFAENHDCSELVAISDRYIKQNFEKFSESQCFQSLPFSYLKQIVSADDVRVTRQDQICEAVIQWVKFSPTKRKDHLTDLMRSVRLSQLTPVYLIERVYNEALVQGVSSCKELVEEAKLLLEREKMSQLRSFITKPRIFEQQICPPSDDFGLYAVCESESGISIKFLNAETQNWLNVCSVEVENLQKVVTFGARIYIFLKNIIKLFHVKTLAWRLLDTEHESLLNSTVVCHNKSIYFFGGPYEGSDIIRCFSLRKNEWLQESQMNRCLDLPGVATLEKFIYVTGGFLQNTIYETVERFDPEVKEWEEVAPMLSRRFSHGCTSLNGEIYACGGSDERDYLSSVEVYDPRTNHWKFVSSMKGPRSAFSIVPHDGKLYALGGMTEGYITAVEMEIYDPGIKEWKSGVPLSDDIKCEIYLVKAKAPTGNDNKTPVAPPPVAPSNDKKEKFIPICYNCGKLGHISRNCWHKSCYNCGKPGHIAGDCTVENSTNAAKCVQCGKSGKCVHDHRPSSRSSTIKCYYCGSTGHLSRDCPSFGSRRKTCYACGNYGHIQDECKEIKKSN